MKSALILALLLASSPLCWGQQFDILWSTQKLEGPYRFNWPAVERCASEDLGPMPDGPRVGQKDFIAAYDTWHAYEYRWNTRAQCRLAIQAREAGRRERQPQDGSE